MSGSSSWPRAGLLRHTLHLVPSDGATLEGEDVRVAFDKEVIDMLTVNRWVLIARH